MVHEKILLRTNRLVLRELEKGDAKALTHHINSIKISQYMRNVPFPYSEKDALAFIAKNLEAQEQVVRREINLAITQKTTNEYLGGVGLASISHSQGSAEVGYWLGEPFWQKGFMTEAASALLEYGFSTLNLRRIKACASVHNQASNAVLRKLGFVHEGIEREGLVPPATGVAQDVHLYSILKKEWQPPK